MKTRTWFLFLLVLAATMIFNGCADDKPDTVNQSGLGNTNPLSIKPASFEVYRGSTLVLTVKGGKPPYEYLVTPTSGGWVDLATGLFHANQPGVTGIAVIDKVGAHAEISVEIKSVVAPKAKNCISPWKTTVLHGKSVKAFNVAVGTCDSQMRTCTDGVLSGTYVHRACVPKKKCVTPWKTSLGHGAFVTAWNVAAGTCVAEKRTCSDGVLSGKYVHKECVPKKKCMTPWKTSLGHGAFVTAWNVAAGTCASEKRMCSDGVLSGKYLHKECVPKKKCVTPWNTAVAHGDSVVAFNSLFGGWICQSQRRTCTDGVLSGKFVLRSCNPKRDPR